MLLLDPVMPIFIELYPDVEVDISVSNRKIDVIGSGFDAGIRYGGTVPEDMIAQRLSPDIRWIAAAAPAYLKCFGTPQTPYDLRDHRCVRVRLGNDQVYQWDFGQGADMISVATHGPLTVDGCHAALGLGLSGAGIIYGGEPVLRPHLERGTLQAILVVWASMGPEFHIYYSGRRQVPTALRLLIGLIRKLRPLGL